MAEHAKLTLKVGGNDQTIDLPIVEGTEKERAVDIAALRGKTGYVALDPAFMNTASTTSAITFLEGILQYRGYPIEQLAEKASFLEVSYLLLFGDLPNKKQLEEFTGNIRYHSLVHEDMKRFFDGYPSTAHPMAILSSMVCSLSSYYPDALDVKNKDVLDITMARLLAKVPTIAAYSYKKSVGQPFVYPQNHLDYCSNFLNMMFSVPAEPYHVDPEIREAMNLLLILHADHEQNAEGGDVKKFVTMAKDKNSGVRLMGFGHRVYKNFDPRAKIIKAAADRVLKKLGINDPLLDIAKRLEEAALEDSYFVDRKLYPNVDFYSGLIYRALGFPTNMFTVLFALGRLPGWIAHWKEMHETPSTKIGRPRQIYTGENARDYVEIAKR